ncbi:MAG: hypothetical protein AUJ57_00230 [Zetaproteobacteria bacterium CG1_02_53_45]|nr:MAG: hypothetical protein AUJ57_00230 [Zetaproteobacteria bacterium CG1_02_53_45]
MDILLSGLLVFFAMHLLPTAPSMHGALKDKLGEKPFKALYSLVSLAGLALIVTGMGQAEFTPWYDPPFWGRHVTALLMMVALYCLISSHVNSSLRMITAHPMNWGIAAWATGHLLANGDRASVLLFGAFLIYSLFDMASANRRGAKPQGQALALKSDGIVLVFAALLYICLMLFHASFTGVPVME